MCCAETFTRLCLTVPLFSSALLHSLHSSRITTNASCITTALAAVFGSPPARSALAATSDGFHHSRVPTLQGSKNDPPECITGAMAGSERMGLVHTSRTKGSAGNAREFISSQGRNDSDSESVSGRRMEPSAPFHTPPIASKTADLENAASFHHVVPKACSEAALAVFLQNGKALLVQAVGVCAFLGRGIG